MEAGAVVGGKFRLEQQLGEGGMGVVWEASNLRTHRVIALKILKAETAEQRRRLFREGRIAGKLRHPNIVEVHDVVELEDGTPAIVMERLQGESLRALLVRDAKVPLARLAEVFTPIARALECAHAQGVVHRDLKPDNVFLARDPDGAPRIKVLDFGIARLTAVAGDTAATAPLTDTGDVIGTPAYMAPEQVFGEKDVDTRADVWSFGVMLYECVTGKKPFVGDNFGQIFKQVAMGEITPVETHTPEVPAALGALILAMLARDRAARPSDWPAIIAVLEAKHGAPRSPRRSRSLPLVVALALALGAAGFATSRLRSAPAPLTAEPAADPSALLLVAASSAPPVILAASAAPDAAPVSPPRPATRPSASASDPVLPGGVHGKSPY